MTSPAATGSVTLETVFLHVTKACNLRCNYCYFSASRPQPGELTAEDYAAVWPDLVGLAPKKIVFTGGEPLLRADLPDLLAGLRAADREHRIVRCLNSNGHLVTAEFADRIVGLVDEVRISLDALAARNDAGRGKGNFTEALRALACYQDAGFEPKVLVTVTSHTLPDLESLLLLLADHQINRISINPFRPMGRGARRRDLIVDQEQVRDALARAWNRVFPGDPLPEDSTAPTRNCGVGSYLNILPNGDIHPCHVLTDPSFRCGNVTDGLPLVARKDGILGELQNLDFRRLADADSRLGGLVKPDACMGHVLAETADSATWRNNLPLVFIQPAAHRLLPLSVTDQFAD